MTKMDQMEQFANKAVDKSTLPGDAENGYGGKVKVGDSNATFRIFRLHLTDED